MAANDPLEEWIRIELASVSPANAAAKNRAVNARIKALHPLVMRRQSQEPTRKPMKMTRDYPASPVPERSSSAPIRRGMPDLGAVDGRGAQTASLRRPAVPAPRVARASSHEPLPMPPPSYHPSCGLLGTLDSPRRLIASAHRPIAAVSASQDPTSWCFAMLQQWCVGVNRLCRGLLLAFSTDMSSLLLRSRIL